MVKLFRNTRKTLINQGKTANYLKYAIGEIVLVMIGILLALQVNNWNEARKTKLEEKTSLKELKQDLLDEASKMKTTQVYTKQGIDYLNKISKGNYNEVPLDYFFLMVAQTGDFKSITVDTKYFGLKNNGKLELISNDTLKDKIMEFYESVHPNLETNIDYHKTYVLQHIEAPLVDLLPLNKELLVTDDQAVIDLLKSSNIMSKVNYQIFYQKRFEGFFENILDSINDIVSDIDKELGPTKNKRDD